MATGFAGGARASIVVLTVIAVVSVVSVKVATSTIAIPIASSSIILVGTVVVASSTVVIRGRAILAIVPLALVPRLVVPRTIVVPLVVGMVPRTRLVVVARTSVLVGALPVVRAGLMGSALRIFRLFGSLVNSSVQFPLSVRLELNLVSLALSCDAVEDAVLLVLLPQGVEGRVEVVHVIVVDVDGGRPVNLDLPGVAQIHVDSLAPFHVRKRGLQTSEILVLGDAREIGAEKCTPI